MDKNSKKSLLIAIPSNDGKTVFPKMLGMAKYSNYTQTITDTFLQGKATVLPKTNHTNAG